MCYNGCCPRKRLTEDLILIDKKQKKLEDLKKEYLFEEHDAPKDSKDYENFVNGLNILKNDHIFQGMLVYATGTSRHPEKVEEEITKLRSDLYHARIPMALEDKGTLRPASLSLVEKGEDKYEVRIAMIFSHNKFLKGYLYCYPDDSLFILDPTLTRRYVKANRKIKRLDFIENMQTIYLDGLEEFNNEIFEKIEHARLLKRATCILYRDRKTYEQFFKEVWARFPENEHTGFPVGHGELD